MTWKVVNNSDPGDSDHFGGDDGDKISNLFSGIDVDDVSINSDWTFKSGKLYQRNPADTFSYQIAPAAIGADRILNLPLITGTDTLASLGLAQTFSAAQTFGPSFLKIRNPGDTFSYTIVPAAIAADRNLNLPLTTATDTLVALGVANDYGDFDNSFKDNRLRIWNPADTFRYTITGAAIAADRQLNLPLTTATDTLASLGLAQTFTATQTLGAKFDMNKNVHFTGSISPAQITSDQNNYAPTGWATTTIINLDADSSFRSITGIGDGSTQTDGQYLILRNVSNNTILLTDSDANSTAANRFDFIITGNADIPLFPGNAIELVYNGSASRWRLSSSIPAGVLIPTPIMGTYYYTDCNNATLTTGDWIITAASGGTAATEPALSGHSGITRLTLGTSTTGSGSIRLGANTILLGSSNYWRFDAVMKFVALSDGTNTYTARLGLIDSGTAESTDGVFLRYTHSVNSGNWVFVSRDNTTESTSNTSSAVSTANYFRATIIINPAGNRARAYINGTQVGSDITTNIPTGAGRVEGAGFMFLKSAGTANNDVVDLDMFSVVSYASGRRST